MLLQVSVHVITGTRKINDKPFTTSPLPQYLDHNHNTYYYIVYPFLRLSLRTTSASKQVSAMNQHVLFSHTQLGSKDVLLDDDLLEETLLMEKASLLLLQSINYLDVACTHKNSKIATFDKPCSSAKVVQPQKQQPKQEEQQVMTTIKSVRFAPESRLEQVEYLAPRSARIMEGLYYSDDEMHMILHQLQCDVTVYCQRSASLVPENNFFSSRGLERRTPQGSAQRAKWRKQCRTVVLDEQDRQWAVLPADEPVDAQRIAFVSLQVTHKAKQLARKRAIQDQKDVLGDDSCITKDATNRTTATAMMDASADTCSRRSSLSSLQDYNSGQTLMSATANHGNKKGHSVRFPPSSRHLTQVFEYQHADTKEEEEALWHPYVSLNQAKLRYSAQIAILEQLRLSNNTDEQQHDKKESSTDEPPALTTRDVHDESLRGLEARTTHAETAYELLRTQFAMTFRYQELDLALFAKHCQKLSAKSCKQARTRGLMDQRAVKAYLYQQQHPQQCVTIKAPSKKKLVTRVPQKAIELPFVPPPALFKKQRSPPSSPTPSISALPALEGDQQSSQVATDIMHGPLEVLVKPTRERRVSDLSLSSLSAGTNETADSTLVSSSWSTLPRMGNDDDDEEEMSLASDHEHPERRLSSVLFGLDRVAEEEEEEENDDELMVSSAAPSYMVICIPSNCNGGKHNGGEHPYGELGVEDGMLSKSKSDNEGTEPLEQAALEEDEDASSGDGYGRLSGIIERLWEERRLSIGSQLIRNETLSEAVYQHH
jgi:hypothetical protein